MYQLLVKELDDPVIKVIEKWESDLGRSDLQSYWQSVCTNYKVCTQVSIQAFYLKFVNCCYALNTLRTKWTNCSVNCSMCNREPETFIHAYWECLRIKHLWSELIQMCKRLVDAQADYSRDNCLLLGFKKPLLNYLVMICKQQIHIVRLFQADPTWPGLIKRIHKIRLADFNAYSQLPGLSIYKMYNLWKPINYNMLKV